VIFAAQKSRAQPGFANPGYTGKITPHLLDIIYQESKNPDPMEPDKRFHACEGLTVLSSTVSALPELPEEDQNKFSEFLENMRKKINAWLDRLPENDTTLLAAIRAIPEERLDEFDELFEEIQQEVQTWLHELGKNKTLELARLVAEIEVLIGKITNKS